MIGPPTSREGTNQYPFTPWEIVIMLKHTIGLAAMTALFAACNRSGPTDPSADDLKPSFAADHTVPGTPGSANCRGQTAAFAAQAGKNGFEDVTARGIGGFAREAGVAVTVLQAAIIELCAE
jgi:hypothetical protein